MIKIRKIIGEKQDVLDEDIKKEALLREVTAIRNKGRVRLVDELLLGEDQPAARVFRPRIKIDVFRQISHEEAFLSIK